MIRPLMATAGAFLLLGTVACASPRTVEAEPAPPLAEEPREVAAAADTVHVDLFGALEQAFRDFPALRGDTLRREGGEDVVFDGRRMREALIEAMGRLQAQLDTMPMPTVTVERSDSTVDVRYRLEGEPERRFSISFGREEDPDQDPQP